MCFVLKSNRVTIYDSKRKAKGLEINIMILIDFLKNVIVTNDDVGRMYPYYVTGFVSTAYLTRRHSNVLL